MPTTESTTRRVIRATDNCDSPIYPLVDSVEWTTGFPTNAEHVLSGLLNRHTGAADSNWFDEIAAAYTAGWPSDRRRYLGFAAVYSDACLTAWESNEPCTEPALATAVATALHRLMQHLVPEDLRRVRRNTPHRQFQMLSAFNRLLARDRVAEGGDSPITFAANGQTVEMLGLCNVRDLRFWDERNARTLMLPVYDECIQFRWIEGGQYSYAALTSTGLIVSFRCSRHASGTVVRDLICVTHEVGSSHPVACILRDAKGQILRATRAWSDRNRGRSAFNGLPITTPMARRAGMDSAIFSRIFNTPRSQFGDSVRETLPSLPTRWRQDAGIPATPTRRSWNWTRIPTEVAEIMERDLTLHLEEPMEASR